MSAKEGEIECFVAQKMTDEEVVAKYAVALDARRKKLGLEDGEEDSQKTLPWESVHEILEELREKFESREDQIRKRASDEERWRSMQREHPSPRAVSGRPPCPMTAASAPRCVRGFEGRPAR